MAITFTSLARGYSSSPSSITTSSISPTNTRMVYVCVNSINVGATPNIPTISGLSQTWTMLRSDLFWVAGRCTVFYAKMSTPGTGTLTIDFGGQSQAYGATYQIVQGNADVDNGGTNGINSIVQSVFNQGYSNISNAIMASFSDANNAALGFVVSAAIPYLGVANPSTPHGVMVEIVDGGTNGDASFYGIAEANPETEWLDTCWWVFPALEIKTTATGSPPPSGPGTFPDIVTTPASYGGASATSHNVTMPSSIAAGDALIAFCWAGSSVTIGASGWTEIGTQGNTPSTSRRVAVFAKDATGSEGSTQTFTCSSAAALDVLTYKIPAAQWWGDIATGISLSRTTGTSSTGDPPSHAPSWGSAKHLWFACVGASQTSTFTTPSSYSERDDSTNLLISVSQRQNETGTENPGTSTLIGSIGWVGITLAVRPAYVPLEPFVLTVADHTLADAQSGVAITGYNFINPKGSGKLYIGDRNVFEDAVLVEQTTTAWTDTGITFTVVKGSLTYGTRYLYVLNSDGGVSDPFAITIIEPLPTEETAPSAIAEVWALIYGSPPVAGLVNITELSLTDGVEQIGTATFSVPKKAEGVSSALVESEIGIWRKDEGEIFRGFITEKKMVIDRNGEKMMRFNCFDLGYELQRLNTHRGFRWEEANVQDVLNDIVGLASGWTIEAIGDFIPITKSIDNMNLLEAIKEIAGIANAFWRIYPATRSIQFRTDPHETGLVFANVGNANVDSRISVISSFDEYSEDGSTVVNRIIPEAKADGDAILTLKESNRTTPYTIQNLFTVPPSIVDIQAADGASDDDDQIMNLQTVTYGDNRWYTLDVLQTPSTKNIRSLAVGSRPLYNTLTGAVSAAGATSRQTHFEGIDPPRGSVSLGLDGVDTALVTDFVAVGIAYKDSHLVWPMFIGTTATPDYHGTGSSAAIESGPSLDTNDQDIVVSVLIRATYADATPTGTDQELVFSQSTQWGKVFVSVQPGDNSGQTTSSWTLTSPGDEWWHCQWVVKAALVYYIEDAASVAAYGLHEQVVPMGTFIKLSQAGITDISNAMYDYACYLMSKTKDPQKFWGFSCSWVNRGPLDWICGDYADVIYHDEDGEEINDRLIPVSRTQEFNRDGTRSWKITFSDRVQFKLDEAGVWLLESLKQRVAAIQINQA